MHCHTEKVRHLGRCNVCDRDVCDRCGNVQYVGGARRVTHDDCVHKEESGFTMIKFVR
jgi:hypothetical protein